MMVEMVILKLVLRKPGQVLMGWSTRENGTALQKCDSQLQGACLDFVRPIEVHLVQNKNL